MRSIDDAVDVVLLVGSHTMNLVAPHLRPWMISFDKHGHLAELARVNPEVIDSRRESTVPVSILVNRLTDLAGTSDEAIRITRPMFNIE